MKIRAIPCVVTLVALVLPVFAMAQTPPKPESASESNSIVRPCAANPVLAASTSKKVHKIKNAPPPEPLPVCVEVKGEGIEVQEFLQNTAREGSWRIGENLASEDSWSFVRYFDPDELEKYSDTKVLIEPVKFTGGKAAVTIRTTDLPDAYCRVQVSARFTGEGRSTDKAWAQPGSSWTLKSKGVFEQEVVNSLRLRYKPVE